MSPELKARIEDVIATHGAPGSRADYGIIKLLGDILADESAASAEPVAYYTLEDGVWLLRNESRAKMESAIAGGGIARLYAAPQLTPAEVMSKVRAELIGPPGINQAANDWIRHSLMVLAEHEGWTK